MANQQHVDMLMRGVATWNQWRKDEPTTRPDLREAVLIPADLMQADLNGTDLSNAQLTGADLRQANLTRADLSGATLNTADLRQANLTQAKLSRASLRQARLNGALLNGALLDRVDFYGANLTGADLTWAYLKEARINHAHLTRANLTEANLTQADLTGSNFSGATLTGCEVFGVNVWRVKLDGAIQADLRVTQLLDPVITTDNLEVAQFLYLLLYNPKIRAILDTITSKVVLILGRFSKERKPVLDAIREALRRHPNGYIPVLFDFEPQQDKPVLETVKTLANLARFVIADLTDPRMVRSEVTYIVPNVPTVPVQPIMQSDADLPPEYATWVLYKSFLPVYRYADLADLLTGLTNAIIAPVEEHVVARRFADADSV